jgi:hypothetical protein
MSDLCPRDRAIRVYDLLGMDAYLRGTLSLLRASANEAGECHGLSYRDIGNRICRTRQTAVLHVAELESYGLVRTQSVQGEDRKTLTNIFRLVIPPAILKLAGHIG